MNFLCFLIFKKRHNKDFNRKKGSALLIVIIVMMLTFILAAFMLDTSIKKNRQAEDIINSTKAYYSAETGVYDFIDYINNNTTTVSIGTKITNLYNMGGLYADNISAYDVEVKKFDNTSKTYTIYSHGSYGSQEYIIVAEVSLGSGTSYFITKKTVYKD